MVFIMEEISAFKKRIVLYTLLTSLFFLLVALPFLGIHIKYIYGLTLGTSISIVNFYVLVFFGKLVISREKPVLASLGMILRLCIYGYAFYMAVKISYVAGLGCLFGFLSQKIAIFYIHGIKPKYSKTRKISPELKEEFEQIDKKREEKRQKREV